MKSVISTLLSTVLFIGSVAGMVYYPHDLKMIFLFPGIAFGGLTIIGILNLMDQG